MSLDENIKKVVLENDDLHILETLLESVDDLSIFFSMALNPFCVPHDDHVISYANKEIVGHALYGLSERCDETFRASAKVYPLSENKWLSLEDWRAKWKQEHTDMPLNDQLVYVFKHKLDQRNQQNRYF
jgi:hypothetical protein